MTPDSFQTSVLRTLAAKLGPAAEFAARDACMKLGIRLEALTPAQTGQFIEALKPDLATILPVKDVQELCTQLGKIR